MLNTFDSPPKDSPNDKPFDKKFARVEKFRIGYRTFLIIYTWSLSRTLKWAERDHEYF